MQLEVAIRLTAGLAGLTFLVGAGEFAILTRTQAGGLLDRRIHARGIVRPSPPILVALLGAASVSVLVAAAVGRWGALAVAAGFQSAVVIGWAYAIPWGRDGADEMALLGSIAAFFMALGAATDVERLSESAAVFVSICLLCAYASSGVSKLAGRPWRSGVAFSQISRTSSYGSNISRWAVGLSDNSSRWIGYTVIAGELAIVAVLIVPPWAAVTLLALGATFHAGTAVLMGLNRFLPAFLCAYPATLWLVGRIH